MSKYTAEQVFAEADRHGDHVADMLRDYAALLRQHESAKAGVTDAMVERACEASFSSEGHSFIDTGEANKITWRKCMRAALEAVAPMLASARSVEAPAWPGYSQGEPPPKDWTRMDVNNLASARVPDGWQLAPKKATGEMQSAGHSAYMAAPHMNCFGTVWAAMLADAPKLGEG